MDGEISAVSFGGFWILRWTKQDQVMGFWSSGMLAWVPSSSESDTTLWSTSAAATQYRDRNLSRLLSARVMDVDEA